MMFKVIYYYYYLFFVKVFSDSEPPAGDVVAATIAAGAASYVLARKMQRYLSESWSDNPFPKPWTIERPNNYIPETPSGPGNHNLPKGAKWIVGGALSYKIYKKFNSTEPMVVPQPLPADNLKVVTPNGLIIVPSRPTINQKRR